MKIGFWILFFSAILSVSLYCGCDSKEEASKEVRSQEESPKEEASKEEVPIESLGKLPMPTYEEADSLVDFVDNGRTFQLYPNAFGAWVWMRDAAKAEGVELQVVSAFRSIKRQGEIVEKKRKKGLSDEEIFKVSARPGYSEHHTGKAIDLTTPGFLALEEEFERSEAFQWLVKNANGFGFYLSYPRDNRYGIIYEPWHWCFKGTSGSVE